ncbi:Uncharacterised protein [Zhongshania aliphaticivorans]|uniref:DUF2970 domain-containing protein n=1 Tax=Zhongshania aliphaticivorans TaxID=1470434 RepID=A0A5S9Q2J7_9GAMM|nr:hypothetical protein [Zhongshania aliphaticivorans]CAA0111098.1 Uncharacterised protein [Zhongshania aliphaticivorans]CAA0118448.1 Uncharacterised protein [Zhongshania aliphaticivorans]
MTNTEQKPLSAFETFKQGISLLFALQNKSGRKRLMDLAETNPMPVVFSGVSAMIVFFLICFVTSQVVLKLVA